MRLVWDEPKRYANLRKHGLDFADAVSLDWTFAVIEPAHADQYGRQRYKVIGECSGAIVALIFSLMGSEAISIISFRAASAEERRTLNEKNKEKPRV